MERDPRPLVLHVVYRFDVGGLENGIVNLINHMPSNAYRHAILALTEVVPSFASRIQDPNVLTISLRKPAGQGFWLYPQVVRLLRSLRPDVIHTRNLAALEMVIPAWWAGVPVRIHGEHGRDVEDLDGHSKRFQRVRRMYRPFVHHYVALSRDLATYLSDKVGVPARSLTQAYNGVDTSRFRALNEVAEVKGCPFDPRSHWIIGTVGRMQTVKDQLTLARAFVHLLSAHPELRDTVRLVMVGDGPLQAQSQRLLDEAGVGDLAWLPGERQDVPAIMQGLHCFVLPSLAEGVSNTILESMASSLPVVATDVGGNSELVVDGRTGLIVPPGDPTAMAQALHRLARDRHLAKDMGAAGRALVESRFSLPAMVSTYQGLYDRMLGNHKPRLAQRS